MDGLSVIVESRDRRTPEDIVCICKLRNRLLRRPAAAIGAVFSRGGFTEEAVYLAHFCWPQTILLWFGRDIEWCLHKGSAREALRLKYHHAVEHGLPDFVDLPGSRGES